MVQTRSQIKAKGEKLPAVHSTTKPLVPHDRLEKQPVKARRKEVTPIIIDSDDEIPPVINLDTKPEFDTQLQDTVVAQKQLQNESRRPGIRQTSANTHPTTRPPPRPPDLTDNRRDPRPDSVPNSNLDLVENSPIRKESLQKYM